MGASLFSPDRVTKARTLRSMKLIFLDVDGVLNKETTEGKFSVECVRCLVEIVNRTQAKIVLSSTWRYTEETRDMLREKLREYSILAADEDFVGFTPHLGLVDALPRFPSPNSHATRTDEILLWIKFNTVPEGTKSKVKDPDATSTESSYNPFPPTEAAELSRETLGAMNLCTVGDWLLSDPVEVHSFVVIDDLPMLKEGCYGYTLERHFVHTSMEYGLTERNVEEAVSILNSRTNLLYSFKRWRKNTFKACTNPDCLLLGEEDEAIREQRRQERRRTQSPVACRLS